MNQESTTQPMDREIKIKELRRCSNRNSLLLLFFLAAADLLGTGAIFLVQRFVEISYPVKLFISYAAMFLVIAPLVLVLGNRGQAHKVKTYFARPVFGANFIVRWTVIGIGITYAASFVFNSLFLIVQNMAHIKFYTPSLPTQTNGEILVTLFASVLLAPLFEEMLFRGTLLRHTERFGEWFAIVSAAIAFGLYHQNYQQIFFAIALGVVSGFIAVRTRSLLPSMLIHFCINLFSLIVSIVAGKAGALDANALLNPEQLVENAAPMALLGVLELGIFAVMIIGVVFFVKEWKQNKQLFHLTNHCSELSTGKKAAVYLLAPGTVVTLLLLLAMTVINAMGGVSSVFFN